MFFKQNISERLLKAIIKGLGGNLEDFKEFLDKVERRKKRPQKESL